MSSTKTHDGISISVGRDSSRVFMILDGKYWLNEFTITLTHEQATVLGLKLIGVNIAEPPMEPPQPEQDAQ